MFAAQTRGWYDPASRQRYLDTMDWAKAHGMITKAHPVMWSRFDYSPLHWTELESRPDELLTATLNHIGELMAVAQEKKIDVVDLLNGPIGFTEFDALIKDASLRAQWFKRAHKAAPHVKLEINEHTVIEAAGLIQAKQDAYFEIIKGLLADGAPVDFIGFQCHMDEDFTPPTRIMTILDRFT